MEDMQFSNGNPIPFFFLAALDLCCGAEASLVTDHRLFSTRAQKLWLRGFVVLGKWDLCSLTRDRTHVPCIGRHWKVDHKGNPYSLISAGYFQQQSSTIFSFPGASALFLYPHPAPNSYKVGCLFSRLVVSDSLWPHGLQHARLRCPSLSLGVCSNSCPSYWLIDLCMYLMLTIF